MMERVTTKKMSKSFQQRVARRFHKPFFRDWDARFLVILFLCLSVEGLIVRRLAQQPVSEYSAEEIAKIQERFASFVLEEVSPRVSVSPGQMDVTPVGGQAVSEGTTGEDGGEVEGGTGGEDGGGPREGEAGELGGSGPGGRVSTAEARE